MELHDFPALNATLNGTTAILLLVGLIFIKRGQKSAHRITMLTAFVTSSVFLGCYLYYHFHHLMTVYPRNDWTKVLYYFILIPHVILAMVMLPFIIMAFRRALKGDFEGHKRLTRWVWPVWMYVSVTGVLVYFMLYQWSR